MCINNWLLLRAYINIMIQNIKTYIIVSWELNIYLKYLFSDNVSNTVDHDKMSYENI